MLVKYINRMASESDMRDMREGASVINSEYKDISTPSYDSRTVVRGKKQAVDMARMRLNSAIAQFIRDINSNDVITNVDINIFKSSIRELKNLMSIQDINSEYSYNSSGRIISGKDFMIRTSKLIFENIINFFNTYTQKLYPTQIMKNISEILVDFAEDILVRHIDPIHVSTVINQFKEKSRQKKLDKSAHEARGRGEDMHKSVNEDDRIERSRIKNIALEKEEDEKLSRRLFQSKQLNRGGKSIKPKQQRNRQTQKKRQRKNQKK
jgi:hypothetical protein